MEQKSEADAASKRENVDGEVSLQVARQGGMWQSENESQLRGTVENAINRDLEIAEKNTFTRPLSSNIPRSHRRGIFARLTVIPEIEDPVQYSPLTKTCILVIIAIAAIAGPMGYRLLHN
jgi:hypothetical protein